MVLIGEGSFIEEGFMGLDSQEFYLVRILFFFFDFKSNLIIRENLEMQRNIKKKKN